MFSSLYTHLAWADDALFNAITAHEGAFDAEMRQWLHHIVVVQRFFLSAIQGRPFDMEREKLVPETAGDMQRLFQEAHADNAAYISRLDEKELSRSLVHPMLKEFQPPVRDVLMQVVMHSEHHRAQCAMRLRAMGGKPPLSDYIAWVRDTGKR